MIWLLSGKDVPVLPPIILFAATYVLMLVFSKYRPYIALASAAIFIAAKMLPLAAIIPAYIYLWIFFGA